METMDGVKESVVAITDPEWSDTLLVDEDQLEEIVNNLNSSTEVINAKNSYKFIQNHSLSGINLEENNKKLEIQVIQLRDLIKFEDRSSYKAYSCCFRCSLGFIDYSGLVDNGYKYVLIFQDNVSKFIILRPLREKGGDENRLCLCEIFSLIGVPAKIYTSEDSLVDTLSAIDIGYFCENFPTKIKRQKNLDFEQNECSRIDKAIKKWMKLTNSTEWSKSLYLVQFQHNCLFARRRIPPFEALFKPSYTYTRKKYTRYLLHQKDHCSGTVKFLENKIKNDDNENSFIREGLEERSKDNEKNDEVKDLEIYGGKDVSKVENNNLQAEELSEATGVKVEEDTKGEENKGTDDKKYEGIIRELKDTRKDEEVENNNESATIGEKKDLKNSRDTNDTISEEVGKVKDVKGAKDEPDKSSDEYKNEIDNVKDVEGVKEMSENSEKIADKNNKEKDVEGSKEVSEKIDKSSDEYKKETENVKDVKDPKEESEKSDKISDEYKKETDNVKDVKDSKEVSEKSDMSPHEYKKEMDEVKDAERPEEVSENRDNVTDKNVVEEGKDVKKVEGEKKPFKRRMIFRRRKKKPEEVKSSEDEGKNKKGKNKKEYDVRLTQHVPSIPREYFYESKTETEEKISLEEIRKRVIKKFSKYVQVKISSLTLINSEERIHEIKRFSDSRDLDPANSMLTLGMIKDPKLNHCINMLTNCMFFPNWYDHDFKQVTSFDYYVPSFPDDLPQDPVYQPQNNYSYNYNTHNYGYNNNNNYYNNNSYNNSVIPRSRMSSVSMKSRRPSSLYMQPDVKGNIDVVGTPVRIRIPIMERKLGGPYFILGVISQVNYGNYKVATMDGVSDRWYTRDQLSPLTLACANLSKHQTVLAVCRAQLGRLQSPSTAYNTCF